MYFIILNPTQTPENYYIASLLKTSMDLYSLAVIGASGVVAYMNSRRDRFASQKEKFAEDVPGVTFTNDTAQTAATNDSVKIKGSPGAKNNVAVAKSAEFLEVRLATMLSEGTLTDVKAVCKQIEDAGLQDSIPDYARAQNIIKSVPNPCGKPQIVSDPTRYQNQPLSDFIHGNFVPFYSGRHTQNMAGTGVPSGNWDNLNDAATITNMTAQNGTDPLIRPSRSTRNPESRVFSVKELGPDSTVWGAPLTRPDIDRYSNPNNSRPDLKPTESIQVGPGLGIDPNKNVHNRGFQQMYRPEDDAQRKIDSKMKIAVEAPNPAKGKFAGGLKGSGAIPFAGGLKPGIVEDFAGSRDLNDSDLVAKYQGGGFVVKKCNEGGARDWHQLPTTGPGNTRETGEHMTQQLLRGETQRGQATPNVDSHYPGLQTGEVKHHTAFEGDLTAGSRGLGHNIKFYKTGIDREKTTREGLPSGAMGNQVIAGINGGPGSYYVNDNFKNHMEMPMINVTNTAGELGARRVGMRVDQDASTTNRQLQTSAAVELGKYGARGGFGHQSSFNDEMKAGHRETTSTSAINAGGFHVSKEQNYHKEKSQRSNLRAQTIAEDKPQQGRTNILSSVKVRVGGFQLNDLRTSADVSDRPHANTAKGQRDWKQGASNVRDTKMIESYSVPQIGMGLAGGYGQRAQDSRASCKNDSSIVDGV